MVATRWYHRPRRLTDNGLEAQINERERVREEFQRTAATFGERTAGRFDHMDVPGFARVKSGSTVVEVGAGTGNFLALFKDLAALLVAVDLTPEMLLSAKQRHADLGLVVGDGARLPITSAAVDLACSAQMLHHVEDPVPILKELARIAGSRGRVLIVDQLAPDDSEQAQAMTELEKVRDPSHAVSRSRKEFQDLLGSSNIQILDEKIAENRDWLSKWVGHGEFPPERVDAVRDFIARRGEETGMEFEWDGDDASFTRRRIMLLGAPA